MIRRQKHRKLLPILVCFCTVVLACSTVHQAGAAGPSSAGSTVTNSTSSQAPANAATQSQTIHPLTSNQSSYSKQRANASTVTTPSAPTNSSNTTKSPLDSNFKSSSVSTTNDSQASNLPLSTNMEARKSKPAVTPERTISLSASFDRAYDNNKEVIAAKYNVDIAKAAIKIAGALPNPKFSLQYGFGQAFTLILAGNPQQFGWQNQIRTAGKRTKQINLAKANLKLADLQVEAVLFDVHNRVRRAYAELAAAEAYAALIESERKVALDLLRISEKRFEAGKAAKAEALQAQLGVLQFETQRNQAQSRLQIASSALSLITGEVPDRVEVIDVDDNGIFKLSAERTALVPPPEHALPPLEQLLPAAFEARPDLKVAIQQRFADRRALTVARSSRIPDIFVDTGYQFTTFKRHQPYNLFPGTVPNSPGCYINVNVEAPIFYQHQGETTQAKETWLQDGDQIDQLRWQIATDIVTAYESVSVARANIFKFQSELIPQATQVARVARRSYEVGKTDLATAILAKQQYQQILSSYFDAVVSYQNAWADLEKAIGVPLQL